MLQKMIDKEIPICRCGCGQRVVYLRGNYLKGHRQKHLSIIRKQQLANIPLPLCQCGCGNHVTHHENKYLLNHNRRGKFKQKEKCTKLCACGCGQCVSKNRYRYVRYHCQRSEEGLSQLKKNREKMNLHENGKKSRLGENKKADELSHEYDSFFQSFRVCDRIGVKNGKITFIEIKKKGEKLLPKQAEFKILCDMFGYEYKIEYIEKTNKKYHRNHKLSLPM
jgi:hypothetical protein